MKHDYYFYRGDMIVRFGKGWCLNSEMIYCATTGIPVYKTVEDARNSIRKRLDGTQHTEPRVVQTAGWSPERSWYVEE